MYSPKEGGRCTACWLASLLGGGWAQWSAGEWGWWSRANNNSKNGNKARLSTMKLL